MMDIPRRKSPTYGLSASNDIDTIFDDLFRTFSSALRMPSGVNVPSVDIFSDDDCSMVVELTAPGFDSDDLAISVHDGVLDIRGERANKDDKKDKRSYMSRENSTSFIRRIALPEGASGEKITAELDKGVLRLMVPVEKTEPQRIEIASPKTKHLADRPESKK
jgi:HSP20 family protein